MKLYSKSDWKKIDQLKHNLDGKLKQYDIILYQSSSLLAPIIRMFIGNPHTHAGIVYDPENQIILEANKLVSPSVVYSWPTFTVLRVKENINISTVDAVNMGKFALEQLGKPYDTLNLISIAINKLRKKMGLKPRPYTDRDSNYFICSEYVDKIYSEGNMDLLPNLPTYLAEPDDFLYSDMLDKIMEVKDLEITYYNKEIK